MDTNEITESSRKMEIPVENDKLGELDSVMSPQRWDNYKNELEASLFYLPLEIRKARIELAFNRWHGVASSKDLLAKAKNKNAFQVGEVFQGTFGAENLDE